MLSLSLNDYHFSLAMAITLAVLGAIIGSFINVVIYRLPLMIIEPTTAQDLSDGSTWQHNKFNLLYPRSHCRICKNPVAFWANIPIVGFFLTLGKCYHCKTPINKSYPLIEIITALLFVAVGTSTSNYYYLISNLVFVGFNLCLIMIDFNEFILPDQLTLSMLWLGLLVNVNGTLSGSLFSSVVGAASGYCFLWLINWIFALITKRDGIGHGDFKYLSAILAWHGLLMIIPMLLLAPLLGIIYYFSAMIYSHTKNSQSFFKQHPQIPFGWCLGIAAIILTFYGKDYLGLII